MKELALPLAMAATLVFASLAPCQETRPTTKSQAHRVVLKNGIEVTSAGRVLRLEAVADGVFRVQIANSLRIPPHSSWAVLSQQSGDVQVARDQLSVTTAGMKATINPETLCLTVTDPSNQIVTQDTPTQCVTYRGDSFRVYKQMPFTEHYFGLGDKAGPTDHREQAYTLWNTDAYHWQSSTDPLYKSIPFFLAVNQGKAYGIFLDDTYRSSFDFGKESRETYSFGAEAGPLDYYIITGPQPKDVVRRYTQLTGRPAMPPRWTFGFQQSRWSYYPENRVHEVADRLRKDRIPADVIYLDIDYQDRNRPFTVDRDRFPNFEGLISQLSKQHFHTIAITDLHIAVAPKGEYPVYDAGLAGDHFLHNQYGSIYSGSVWPGPSSFPEFTRASTRDWWGSLYTGFYQKDGIAGFWNDMNEPAIFQVATKTIPTNVVSRIDEPGQPSRTTTQAETHNVFGMLNSRATYEGLLKLKPNQRPFVLTRASYAGGQRYAATWTGDNSSTWDHMRISTHQLVNLGLSGFAFSGADIGGYAGTPQTELLTRWLELGAFNPIDRDHSERGTADQEPWVSGPEHEGIRRRYIEERYRLMPYLYTLAQEAAQDGIPLMRPLFLEFPFGRHDGRPLDVGDADNQFMLGPAMMIAPPPFPDTKDEYSIWFPEDTAWFDYWTGERIATERNPEDIGGAPLLKHAHPPLDVLPIYVRAGSIIPQQPLTQSTDEVPDGPLSLHVYLPDAAAKDTRCEGDIYLDDGQTFDYRKGTFYRGHVSCVRSEKMVTITYNTKQHGYAPWWKEIEIHLFDGATTRLRAMTDVRLNGKPLDRSAWSTTSSTESLRISIPATDTWTLTMEAK